MGGTYNVAQLLMIHLEKITEKLYQKFSTL